MKPHVRLEFRIERAADLVIPKYVFISPIQIIVIASIALHINIVL
jgi:hypothetical protein